MDEPRIIKDSIPGVDKRMYYYDTPLAFTIRWPENVLRLFKIFRCETIGDVFELTTNGSLEKTNKQFYDTIQFHLRSIGIIEPPYQRADDVAEQTSVQFQNKRNPEYNFDINHIKKGDVLIASLIGEKEGSEQTGDRFVLAIQDDNIIANEPKLVVACMTTQPKKRYPTHVKISKLDYPSLRKNNIVLCEQLEMVDKKYIKNRKLRLNGIDIARVNEALKVSITNIYVTNSCEDEDSTSL